jgi:hypothetical protein
MPRNQPKRKKSQATHNYSKEELNWRSSPIHYHTLSEGEDPLCRTGPARLRWTGPVPMATSKEYAPRVRRVGVGFLKLEVDPPAKVYRFFKEKAHADALAAGNIWISTLQRCREYEDPKQGDPKDGYLGENKIQDALVLCTTLRFDPSLFSDSFGNYCVEITDPQNFFLKLTDELIRRYPITRYVQAKVIYADRSLGGDDRKGRIGFVKPADQYADQEEHRMLWTVEVDSPLKPGLIKIPALKTHCRIYEVQDFRDNRC